MSPSNMNYRRLAVVSLLHMLFIARSANGFGQSPLLAPSQQHQQQQQQHSASVGRCERITIPLCKGMKYNMTRMPNLVGQTNQKDATLQVNEFIPLVQFGCSRLLKFFLCSLYAPMCTEQVDETLVIPACRSMCLDVKSKCEPVLERFSFHWPPVLDCNQLPERSDRSQLCIDPPDADMDVIDAANGGSDSMFESMTHNPEMIRLLEILRNGGAVGSAGAIIPGSLPGLSTVNPKVRPRPGAGNDGVAIDSIKGRDSTPRSPSNWAHNQNQQQPLADSECGQRYLALQSHHGNETVCAGRCGVDVLYRAQDKRFSEVWMTVWSVICLFVTTITLITYFMDSSRFRYPERPVVLLAACSAVNSCAYIIRAAVGREMVACDVTGRHLLLDGLGNTWCVVVFLVSYFFTMSSSVWWVVLAVSFYLSAGRKWSREAIESRAATYFHVVAWSLPTAATVAALALRRIDADELTGVCLVGGADRNALVTFVIVPLLVCLVVGSAFVAAGFAAMFRIRGDLIKRGGSSAAGCSGLDMCGEVVGPSEIRSLEKLMVKIGIFSVLYTVPATCVVACFLYQRINMDKWRQLAIETECKRSSPEDCSLEEPIAPVEVQLLRVLMLFAGGMSSSMWICSRKTFDVWRHWCSGRVRSAGGSGRRWANGSATESRKYATPGSAACGPTRMTSLGSRGDTTATGIYRKCDPGVLLLQSTVPRTRV